MSPLVEYLVSALLLAGGGFALVWIARERKVHVLDFREVAPAGSGRDMFLTDGKPDPKLSREGGLAVPVPGAVKPGCAAPGPGHRSIWPSQ